jgi:predicted metal-dependent phosphoesterase TrpH
VKTLAEIEAAIEALSPADRSRLVAWMEERRMLEASAGSLFQLYEEEENLCRSRVAEKSG